MFKKLSLKAKLFLLCIFLSAMCAAVGTVGYISQNSIMSSYGTILDRTQPKLMRGLQMNSYALAYRLYLGKLSLPDLNQKDAKAILAKINQTEEQYEKVNKEYFEMGFIPGMKEIYTQMQSNWLKSKDLGHQIVTLFKSGDKSDYDTMVKLLKSEESVALAHSQSLDDLIDHHIESQATLKVLAKENASTGHWVTLFLVSFGCFLGLLGGYLFSSRIVRVLTEITHALSEGAQDVTQASQRVFASSRSLAETSSDQAGALQQTVASVDQINSMVSKNAENAANSRGISTESAETANAGKAVVESMIQSMDQINASTNEILSQTESSNRELTEIVKLIHEIGAKTKVIDDIVFQTKLLSFNASVEAARAGEHGKGFAVVAEEVGNLAQMSGNAAKEISNMLEGSISKVEKTVSESKQKVERLVLISKEKVDAGLSTAKQCGEMLEKIVTHVSDLSIRVSEISDACKEQSSGVSEINKAMSALDGVTQKNALASKDTAQAGEALQNQALQLRGAVAKLVGVLDGQESTASPRIVHKSIQPQVQAGSRPQATNVVSIQSNAGARNSQQLRSSKSPIRVKRVAQASSAAAMTENVPSHDDPGFN